VASEKIKNPAPQGTKFHVNRLTIIKSFCAEPEAATAFALFLAQNTLKKMRRKNYPQRFREFVDPVIKELTPYSADPTEERRTRLSSLGEEMTAEQNDYKQRGRNVGRMLKDRDLVLVDECVRSVITRSEAPFWAYHASTR
jgi:hypothetical protein